MNPLIKYLIKQIEDSSVLIEKATRSGAINRPPISDQAYRLDSAFDTYHSALRAVKEVVLEVLS